MTPTPNVELIRKVIDAITTRPEHFDMGGWAMTQEPSGWYRGATETEVETLPCGTTMCIAGWALLLDGKLRDLLRDLDAVVGSQIAPKACAALGAPNSGLLYAHKWPEAFDGMDEKVAAVKLLEMVAAGEDPWA